MNPVPDPDVTVSKKDLNSHSPPVEQTGSERESGADQGVTTETPTKSQNGSKK